MRMLFVLFVNSLENHMTQRDDKFRVQNGKYVYINSYVCTWDKCAPNIYSLYLVCNIEFYFTFYNFCYIINFLQ